ncbi:uncharacterized protein EURHEDRAFT_264469 [Aspergillus ruber CBS 135680]|uniref:Uncharacterized protein n=1 Tax=Aspergillus ruber (strain CBS 135680) TaxID=1388766 RepID=A0A017SLX2_ASPRC|nr:uncharacterized protein EURHEDRAFT_264469 [Aspergillus ruber CBS 135680]EYE97963.1 hypothetical protein EURHEDRAFT_264469 [Aspergillus ruber CBS 135680]
MRVQIGSALSLFAGSGARAGAVVESSSYRNINECLYYKHLTFNLKWSENGSIERWVVIDSEFLKGSVTETILSCRGPGSGSILCLGWTLSSGFLFMELQMAHLRVSPLLMSSCRNGLRQGENLSRLSGQIAPRHFLFSAW